MSFLRRALRTSAIFAVVLTSTATAQGARRSRAAAPDWSSLDDAIGRKGAAQPGGVMKYGFPRGDLHVEIGGVALKPALALGGWVAFVPLSAREVMAMGDLVLTEDEVGPVMQRLQQGGIAQTAVHNHLLGESPRVLYMHVMARGDAVRIGGTLREALAATGTPPASSSAAATSLDLDTAAVARTLGVTGKVNGGVYQVSVPRAERIVDMGREIPPSMGVATGINFQPTGGGHAAVTGDFVLIGSEVNPVIRALRDNGIQVTALHSHLLSETPRLFFMHFWANDDAVTLAKGLRAALDRMHVKK